MANPVHFLRLYFNCAYFLGIFPFRFQYAPEIGRYVIVRSIWQRVSAHAPGNSGSRIYIHILVISILFQILWTLVCFLTISNCLFFALMEYDIQNKKIGGPGRPELYFRRVNLMTDGILFLIILITQCTGAEKLLKLFNTLNESTSYDSTHKNQFQVSGSTSSIMLLLHDAPIKICSLLIPDLLGSVPVCVPWEHHSPDVPQLLFLRVVGFGGRRQPVKTKWHFPALSWQFDSRTSIFYFYFCGPSYPDNPGIHIFHDVWRAPPP